MLSEMGTSQGAPEAYRCDGHHEMSGFEREITVAQTDRVPHLAKINLNGDWSPLS